MTSVSGSSIWEQGQVKKKKKKQKEILKNSHQAMEKYSLDHTSEN